MRIALTIFFLSFLSNEFYGQNVLCATQDNASIDISSLNFDDCSGALTYNITGSSNGLNCTDCGNTVGPVTASESITVSASSAGVPCQTLNVSVVYLEADFTYNAGTAPACNEFDFSATGNPSAVTYQWDFNDDGLVDASGQNITWTFTNSGNQTVNLTVLSSGGNCSFTTSDNVFISGPWPDLSLFGNPNGDANFEELGIINFNNNACTVPLCVDDDSDVHCLHLSEINHPNANVNSSFEIFVDGVSVYSGATPPSDEEHCYPSGFSGYSTVDYVISDNAGCVATKSYSIYIAEDVFPNANVTVDIPSTNGFCIDEVVEFEIEADNSNPEDLMYIIMIDCLNLNFDEISAPVFLDTLYLAPGEVYAGDWNVSSSSCHCTPTGQYEIYTFMLSPCIGFPFPGGSGPFTVNLNSEAAFDAPETLCQNQSFIFEWANAEELGSGICDADPIWTVTEPGGSTPIEVGSDIQLDYQFLEIGTYTICLEIDGACDSPTSTFCQDICIDTPINDASLDMTWPDLTTTFCEGQTINPSVFVAPPFCGDVNYIWSVSPVGSSAVIINGNTANPTITFNDKGDYVITVTANAPCGSGQQNSGTISVGGAPQLIVNETLIGGCPNEPLCLDEAFCVDDCNANFTTATLTIYEGVAGPPNCDASGLIEEWSAPGSPLISFPIDMQGITCMSNNSPCDFQWDVPNDADGDYVAVLFLENECGAIINCVSINISATVEPANDIPVLECIGNEMDPNLTNFSDCEWTVGGLTLWTPGDGPIIITETIFIEVSCSSTGCPFIVTHEIEAIPAPDVTITGPLGICDGGSTTLTANTAVTQVDWFNLPCSSITSGSVPDGTGSTFGVNAVGFISVQVINDEGCKSCEEVEVIFDQAPVLNCSDMSICESEVGQVIDLSCLLAPGGTWNGNEPVWNVFEGVNQIASDVGSTYTVSDLISDYGLGINANITFDFNFEWTSDLGCNYSGTFSVEILNEGVNDLSENLCTGEEFEMDGGVSGLWTPQDFPTGAIYDITGSVFTWTPSNSDVGGPYTLTFQPDAGCAVNEITINVNLSPTVDLSTVNDITNFCEGSNLTLNATPGFENYEWLDNVCGSGSAIPGEILEVFDVNTEGSYSIIVTDLNGCLACDDIVVGSDPSPQLTCADMQFCENETDELINLSCLNPPPDGWGVNPVVWGNHYNGTSINDNVLNPYSVQDILNDLGSDLTVDSEFFIAYEWTSPAGCIYSDSISVIILNEGINQENVDVCSGEEIDITPDGSNGLWIPSNFAANPDTSSSSINFLWVTENNVIGGIYDLEFISGAGCSSFEYEIEIYETPNGSIIPSLNNLCVENTIDLTFDPGSSINQTLVYEYDINSIDLGIGSTTFNPSGLGLIPDDDGQLVYAGWTDFTTPSGLLTCSFSDEVSVNIIDFPASLFFPSNICEGEEFEPTVCSDPYIDSFELDINGINYTACPLDLGTLNGVNPYTLTSYYGGAANCMIDTSGSISIQEQLIVEFTSSMDSCSAEVEVDFNVISGLLNGIVSTPSGDFTDDVVNQTIILPIADVYQDQDFNYTFSVDDDGCDVLDYNFSGTYIGQINPAIIIEPGPYCSGQAISFILTQAGSSFVDSVIVYPGNGDVPYTWIDDDYTEPLEFIYDSPLDSSLMIISFELFNQCHDTLVVDTFVVEPPQLIAFMDPVYYNCPGTILDLDPEILGNYSDYDIFVSPDLLLSLIDATEPFVFQISADQEPGIFDIEIIIEPYCGDPTSVFTEVEIYAVPAPVIISGIDCSGSMSVFSIENSSLMETYEWIIDGQSFLGDPVEHIFNVSGSYDLFLETTNTNECVTISEWTVIVGGVNEFDLFEPISQCGDIDITLMANTDPAYDVHWEIINDQTGEITEYFIDDQSLSFVNNGTEDPVTYDITLEIVDSLGCETVAETYIEIFPLGSASIEYYNDTVWQEVGGYLPLNLGSYCVFQEFLFRDGSASNSCGWTTSLHPCSSNTGGFCPGFAVCADEEQGGWLTLSTYNPYGCPASDSLNLFFKCDEPLTIFVPNTFTPNGDGLNELFRPIVNVDVNEYEWFIYDRYGDVVFAANSGEESWNGKGRVNENYFAPNGMYTWQLKFKDESIYNDEIHVGHVFLVR